MAGARSGARHSHPANLGPRGGDELPRPSRTGQSAHQRRGRSPRREAIEAADHADHAVAAGRHFGAARVPVTYDFDIDYAGRPTTNGMWPSAVSRSSTPRRLRTGASGAIGIGRTNVPPFGARFFTSNALHGRTLDPWDPGVTPGGSTGGGTAAVASGSGLSPTVADRAGSVRIPLMPAASWVRRPSGTFRPVAPLLPKPVADNDRALARTLGPHVCDLRLRHSEDDRGRRSAAFRGRFPRITSMRAPVRPGRVHVVHGIVLEQKWTCRLGRVAFGRGIARSRLAVDRGSPPHQFRGSRRFTSSRSLPSFDNVNDHQCHRWFRRRSLRLAAPRRSPMLRNWF